MWISALSLGLGNAVPSRRLQRTEDDRADLCRLGEALSERTQDVVVRMAARIGATLVDPAFEERFVRLATVATIASARGIAEQSTAGVLKIDQEEACIFSELAAARVAPLDEMITYCLRWRDAAGDIVSESAAQLRLPPRTLSEALASLQRSLDAMLIQLGESLESERQRSDEELTFVATHDGLTGLPNRTLILDRLSQLLAHSRRHRTSVAAVFIDLDNFKIVNDTLGHSAGDELLQAAAARLEDVVRVSDALGRLGGDEFVVVVDEVSFTGGPELVATRLLETFAQPFILAGGTARLTVTASVGIASGARASAEEILRDADIAMYRAKGQGKNRYVVFAERTAGLR